ncbi:MAG TPA: zinc-binding dehydrogenase [Acidimicrobiales bacterium]|jgi:threonine dehydrogenase-like Zn-dependent dehydrogenase|nr:zinc-binding dehydrogenase [Acidimicrobiales bacterium]
MKALVFERHVPRLATARLAGALRPGWGARYGPVTLDDVDPPDLPGESWVRLRPRLAGICGSDLSTVDGTASRYFEPIVSFPFTPGHEVVADDDTGRRVVLEPVLGCVARHVEPVCAACARGDLGNCQRLAFGALAPGLQSGFCCDTGGGWGTEMVAHPSQLHPVPEDVTDEAAVMIEPTACAIHGALRWPVREGDLVVVLGAGTLGLLTVAALRRLTPAGVIVSAARYPHQRELARALGADRVCDPAELPRLIRRLAGSMAYTGTAGGDQLTGGCDVVIDCVGSADTLQQSLAIVAPRGAVVVVGMPAAVKLELTTLWHRETALVGAYAYGTETLPSGDRPRTFDLAFDLVRDAELGRLVSAMYPLDRFAEAIEHAANAGRRGAVKVVFDLRHEKGR